MIYDSSGSDFDNKYFGIFFDFYISANICKSQLETNSHNWPTLECQGA